ncbi:MAG: accessory factor UbiK family protein [Methylobacillus sp.]|jgi:BMFP domain-containing protein YqiC|nr:accessory factor UbiK family protein [Methylobacillus sp.]
MLNTQTIEEISGKIKEMLAKTPAADLEKNLQALLRGVFAKLDLVTREEFDAQTEVLHRARAQLDALEQRLSGLEAREPG